MKNKKQQMWTQMMKKKRKEKNGKKTNKIMITKSLADKNNKALMSWLWEWWWGLNEVGIKLLLFTHFGLMAFSNFFNFIKCKEIIWSSELYSCIVITIKP